MHITLPKGIIDKMTPEELAVIDSRDHSSVNGLSELQISLGELEEAQVDAIENTLLRVKAAGSRQTRIPLDDLRRWREAVSTADGCGDVRPRNLKQFADAIAEYLRVSPGRRIYRQQDESGVWLASYVNYVEYVREYRVREEYRHAHVILHLLHYALGTVRQSQIYFYASKVDGRTVAQALALHGCVIESDDLRLRYLHDKEKFDAIFARIGRQHSVSGYGYSMSERFNRNALRNMTIEGQPAKAVVDVPHESSDESSGSKPGRVQLNFWQSRQTAARLTPESDAPSINDDLLNGKRREFDAHPEVPVHPYVPVYHLHYHRRYLVHVRHMEEWEFDTALGDLLILPPDLKNLVEALVAQGRISFQDIIEGKGAGACILLGGPPGVGKTLTAEVFSESTQRPLLSVHAAQLGTDTDNIERNLRNILILGSRWNAVVLIDEADVYIAERGHDLRQNAIVAAFLRVLENHTSTIFMTTNRLDSVDDAITSRCLACVEYQVPTKEDQRRIWEVINRINEAGLTARDMDRIVENHPDLSGRDIKQLMKLAQLWSNAQGQRIDPEAVSFARGFLPAFGKGAGEQHPVGIIDTE